MSQVPTTFPTGGPLDQAKVTRTQLEAHVKASEAAIMALREAKGAALTEASVEMQAILALQTGIDLAVKLLPLAL
jgi:hypothetical protein